MAVKVPVAPVVASSVVKKVEPKVAAVVSVVVDSEPVFAPWAVEARAKAITNVVSTAEVPAEDTGRDQFVVLLATAAIISPLMVILQQQ